MKPAYRMRQYYRSTLLALGLMKGLAPLPSSAADDFLPEEKAYYLCAGCHGPDTGSVLYPMPHDIPTLIGQKKDYLLKQLLAYRDGHRKHPNMSDVLTNYTDQNLAALAEYYEQLGPKRPVRSSHTVKATGATVPATLPPVVESKPSHHHPKKAKKVAAIPAAATPKNSTP